MNRSAALIRLWAFIREIDSYYANSCNALAGDLVITRAMIEYALSDVTGTELNALIDSLKAEDHIIATTDDQLTFSPAFLTLNFAGCPED